jgi:hypothetical protein
LITARPGPVTTARRHRIDRRPEWEKVALDNASMIVSLLLRVTAIYVILNVITLCTP